MGQYRLPGRTERRTDPAPRPSLHRRGCVGRGHERPSLPKSVDEETGAGLHPRAVGQAVRPTGGGRVPADDPG